MCDVEVIFQKRVRVLSWISKRKKTFETTRPQAGWFKCLRAFGNPIKHDARVFEISSPTKEIIISITFFKSIFFCTRDRVVAQKQVRTVTKHSLPINWFQNPCVWNYWFQIKCAEYLAWEELYPLQTLVAVPVQRDATAPHVRDKNRPNQLTQSCPRFKSLGVKILCVLHLHCNAAFIIEWYKNTRNKAFYSQRVWIGYNI